jgi:cysteine sulfinate desulfinase/cysteine desulfurase-like protein
VKNCFSQAFAFNATCTGYTHTCTALRFGNPSSGHAFARPCKDAIDLARAQVADMLGCQPNEVVFTSCGSESDNHAIASAVAGLYKSNPVE